MNRLWLAVAMMLALWPAQAFARHCSNSSLKGTYTYAFEAKVPGGGAVAAVVGTIKFDGKGNFTGANTQNFGSGQVGPVPFEGTYTVNADCTYTSEFGGSTQFGIIAQHGEKIRVLNTDAGLLLAFTGEREEESDK